MTFLRPILLVDELLTCPLGFSIVRPGPAEANRRQRFSKLERRPVQETLDSRAAL